MYIWTGSFPVCACVCVHVCVLEYVVSKRMDHAVIIQQPFSVIVSLSHVCAHECEWFIFSWHVWMCGAPSAVCETVKTK